MACVPIGAFIIKDLPLANTNKKRTEGHTMINSIWPEASTAPKFEALKTDAKTDVLIMAEGLQEYYAPIC